jgi:hypothetical protein
MPVVMFRLRQLLFGLQPALRRCKHCITPGHRGTFIANGRMGSLCRTAHWAKLRAARYTGGGAPIVSASSGGDRERLVGENAVSVPGQEAIRLKQPGKLQTFRIGSCDRSRPERHRDQSEAFSLEASPEREVDSCRGMSAPPGRR